jgi:RND family efflux transporter MFP subunit
VEQVQLSLELAQSDLDDLLTWEPDPDEIAQAEANLAAAQAAYTAAQGQEYASGANVTVAAIQVNQAERNLADAQAAYDTAYDPGRDWELGDPFRKDRLEAERDAAARAVTNSQEQLEIAQAEYNAAVAGRSSSGSTNAQSSVLGAQLALEKAQTGPTEEEMTAARTAVRQAELTLKQAQLNQEADALSLEQARLNLEAAQDNLDATTLTASMDGVITAINGSVSEMVGTSAFITLADLEQPVLEVYLDETDLNMVAEGYPVQVVLDAFPDETYSGTIIQVDPQLVNTGGVSAVRALVQLDPTSFAKPRILPAGLNASAEVIAASAENALLVPVEAVRELSEGEYAVFVMEDGEPRLRLVEIGLSDFTFTEILSGVEEGDVVTTGVVETGQS